MFSLKQRPDADVPVPAATKATVFLGSDGRLRIKKPDGSVTITEGGLGRVTATYTTASLADGATEVGLVTLSRGYRLLLIQTTVASRVRLYPTVAQRTADLNRPASTAPTSADGVMIDYVTTATALTASLSPVVDGFDNKPVQDGTIPVTVSNTSGAASVVTVTFTYVRTE